MAKQQPMTRRDELAGVMRRRILSRLHLGVLRAGDRLPSVREAAKEFDVDPRVVLAAYRDLEQDHIVTLRNRSGVFVGGLDPSTVTARALDAERQTERLIDQAADALRRGIPAPAFAEHAHRAFTARHLRAVVLERNDDQLWSTTDELRRDYGLDASAVDMDTLGRADPIPSAVRRADLLVTTSPTPDVLDLAERADVPLHPLVMCPDLFDEVRRLLADQPVYFVVSDPRFAARVRSLIGAGRGRNRFHVLVYGRDDVRVIPSDAPLYLTRLTRDSMERAVTAFAGDSGSEHDGEPERPLLNRGLSDARVFSAESARGLLSFVVRSNLQSHKGLPLPVDASAKRARDRQI